MSTPTPPLLDLTITDVSPVNEALFVIVAALLVLYIIWAVIEMLDI